MDVLMRALMAPTISPDSARYEEAVTPQLVVLTWTAPAATHSTRSSGARDFGVRARRRRPWLGVGSQGGGGCGYGRLVNLAS